jgi:hypothetical protein
MVEPSVPPAPPPPLPSPPPPPPPPLTGPQKGGYACIGTRTRALQLSQPLALLLEQKKKIEQKEQPLLRLPRWSPTLVLVLRTKCISAEAMQDVAAQLGVQAADKAQGEGRNMHLSAPARPRAPPPNVRGAARAHPRRRQRDHHPLRAAGAGGAGGRRGRGAGSGE